jgi:hypothetical protein
MRGASLLAGLALCALDEALAALGVRSPHFELLGQPQVLLPGHYTQNARHQGVLSEIEICRQLTFALAPLLYK